MNVSLMALWLPILLSAVIVFIASSVVWMVLKYHDSEWKKLPDEEAARSALRGASPGQYSIPNGTAADRNDPAWQEKFKEGPAAMVYVTPHASLAVGKQLVHWFIY